MILSKKGAAFIRGHEGFRSRAYRDPVGVLTIGIGFTWRSAAFRAWWNLWKETPFDSNATMTEEEADDALQYMVEREYGKAVNDFLGGPVQQHVYDAMVSAVFNMGPGSLKWQWAKAAAGGDYELAARLLMKTGTTAKGKTLPGLVRRRKEEALLLQHGVYTGIRIKDDYAPTRINPAPSPVPTPPARSFWGRLFGWPKRKETK
jgi:lysozyme